MNCFIFALCASIASVALALDADAFARTPEQRARILSIRETPRLRDVPPAGSGASQYLDGEDWTVVSADGAVSIEGFVPGDLVTDLQLAGVMGDPIYDQNWLSWLYDKKSAPLWDATNFTYTKIFDADAALLDAGMLVQLTFDGVKMAADVSLNGIYLGFTNDMFLRTVFDATAALRAKDNVLSVTFTTSSDPRNEAGRWPASAGGWDWAFYSQTAATGANLRTFSKGIWRSVYLVPVSASGAVLAAALPLVSYLGDYPTSPLSDSENGPWRVDVRAFFDVPGAASVSGVLSVQVPWSPQPISQPVTLPSGSSTANITLPPVSNMQLWWPVDLGAQPLYVVNVSFSVSGGAASQSITRPFSFRTAYLVTSDDSDPASLKGVDGSGNFTFRYKVNGCDLWLRGGNIIPPDEMEGRLAASTFERIVDAAADAHMNALRIWGGGIYPPDVFYDRADARGVLIRHDAMFAGDGRIPPSGSALEDLELRQQVRRIATHPSVVSYDACNECGGGGIYATFVNTVMAEEDPTRPQWPSNPSQGWVSGVDRLTGIPNGNPLVARKGEALRAPGPTTPLALRNCASTGSADNCTLLFNVDFTPGPVHTVVDAADPPACCASCTANATLCSFAVFFEGSCYYKTTADAALPVWSAGRVAVWPTSAGPVPPAPAPTPSGIIEQHGPYQHGGGWPAVNGYPSDGAFNANVPPTLTGPFTAYGTRVPGIFYSEFGASGWSSFESVAPTLPPAHWALHGGAPANPAATCKAAFSGICPGANPLAQRNYPADSFFDTYFPAVTPELNTTGVASFQKQLYLAVLSHGLELKSDVTGRRSNNHYGTIWWQLNEIWPTGGWGSIEYGTVGFTSGQVIGGRWKAIQHFANTFLMTNVFIACGVYGATSAACFARNDDPLHALNAIATVKVARVSGVGAVVYSNTTRVTLGPGAAAVQWWCLGGGSVDSACENMSDFLTRIGCSASGTDCVIFTTIADSASGATIVSSFELLGIPGSLELADPALAVIVAPAPNADGSVNVTVTAAAAPAAFVTLTTQAPGRFTDNSFWVGPAAGATTTVAFLPFGHLDYELLASTLRVEHLQQYL